MKDKFLSKAYGGVTVARRKLYGLGLPRQWKVITSTLLLLFTFAIGNVWADDYTFAASTFASDKLSATVDGQTFTFSLAHGGNGSNSYAGGQGGKYVKISTGKTETITFPSGFVATNLNIKGYTNKESTADGVKPNAEISEVAGVSQTGKTFPYRDLGSISEYDFAIAANATSVTFKTKGSTEQSCLLITITGTASGSATTYSITYECDGADSGCPANVASATALPNPLPSAPVKDGFTFDGWYTNSTKTTAAVAGASLSADATLYAKWTENAPAPTPGTCPENGTIYKFVVKTGLTNGTVSETGLFGITTTNYLSSFTSTNGALQGYNNNSKFQIADNKSFKLTDKSNSYVKIDLGDCEFEKGDILKYIITSQNVEIYLSTAKTSAQKLTLTKSSNSTTYVQYALAEGDSPIGESVIYVYGASNSPQIYSFEVIRPLTITLDATTNGGTAVEAVKGAVGDKVVLPHAFKDGKKFKGWYDAATGGTKQANYYTVSAATTLYAQFEDLPTSGEMFKLTMESSMKPSTQVGLASKKTLDLLQYATITGGAAVLENTTSSNDKGRITTSGECSFNDNGVLVTLTLDFPLAKGDVIEHVCNSSYELCYTATKTRSTAMSSSSKKYTVTDAADGLKGKSVIYVWRVANSETKVTSIKVTRPIFRTITLEYADGVTSDGSLEVVDGEAATKPADPTWEHHRFDGWYNGATPYDWTANVTGDLTLTAHWTQLYTISFANGGGSGDAPAAVADKAQGETFEVPANTYDAPVNKVFAGWNDGTNDYAPGDTYTVGTANVLLTAQWINANFVARIGSNYYATLADALVHAAEGEIVLLQDINVDAQVEIADGVTATIDLNGHKIEYTGSTTLSSGVILVHNGGSLTINDSSDPDAGSIVAGEKAYAALALTKAGDNAANPATLIINGGTYTGLYYAITGNGARHNTNTTINGGTFTATAANDNLAIYHPQNGILTINGGSFEGYLSAIEMRAGSLVINDGSFTATAPTFSCNAAGSGTTTQGAAIAIAQHTTKKDIEVTINGGTFNGVKALNESNPQANDPAPQVDLAITAGTFTGEVTTVDVNKFVSGGSFSEPVAEENCATGYVPETKANGKYGVIVPAQSIDFEAIIDTYGTDATAIAELDAQLAAKHYDIDGTLNDDRLDNPDGKPYDKGFKVKKTGLTISFSVEAGKVVEITTGSLSGASIKVNDAAAVAMTASHTHTYYSDDAQAFLITMTAASNKYNIFKSINIRDPYQVTFEAHGDADPAALQGKPSVILPSATNGTKSLTGWFTEETGGTKIGDATDEYTPTANITLHAQWEDISTDARLASITLDPSTGVLSPAFDPEVVNYTYTMPYGTAAIPQITGATAVNAGGSYSIVSQASAWDETAVIRGVAASSDTKAYNITMKLAPKDGICLIKGIVGNNTFVIDEDASLLSGTTEKRDVRSESSTYEALTGWKFQSKGAYLGITLDGDNTFQENDVVEVYVTTLAGDGTNKKVYVYTDKTTDNLSSVLLASSEADQKLGKNQVVLPATTTNKLYLCRGDDKKDYVNWNPYVAYFAVYRPLPPVLKKVTVNGVEGKPNALNEIVIEVAASTTQSELEAIAYEWVSNSDAWTANPANAPVAANAWEFGVANTVTLTDKDGDVSVYTVTVNKAIPSSNVELATLTVDGNAITLVPGQAVYSYEYPYGTAVTPAPVVAATAEDANAEVGTITPAATKNGTATFTVTAEDGITYRDYTVKISVSRIPSIAIYDGSTMDAIAENGSVNGLTWSITGANTLNATSAAGTFEGKNYAKEVNLFTSATKGEGEGDTRYVTITIPEDYVAKFRLVGASNSSGSDASANRSIFISKTKTGTLDKSIAYATSMNYNTLAGMTSDYQLPGVYYLCADKSIRLYELSVQLYPIDYSRATTEGRYGTICLPNGGIMVGATLYEVAYYGATSEKIFFDEILNGEMVAGVPYIYLPNEGADKLAVFYTDEANESAKSANGLVGYIGASENTSDALPVPHNDGNYILNNNQYREVVSANSAYILSHRAYIHLAGITPSEPALAPGRRRISMSVYSEQVATGIENTGFESEAPRKVLINGELFIIRGEKMYDAKGQLVK